MQPLCKLQTTVTAPIGQSVVLGVTPVQSKPSVFVLQLRRPATSDKLKLSSPMAAARQTQPMTRATEGQVAGSKDGLTSGERTLDCGAGFLAAMAWVLWNTWEQ